MRRAPSFLLALSLAVAPAAAVAQVSDPAAARVDAFYDVLLDTMKQAKSLGVEGRYRKLEPAVERTLDIPAMTRFAVGPKWTSFSPAEQAQVTKAFKRMSVATYAKNFDSFSGQSFKIDPKVQTRGADKLVKTQLIQTGGKAPVDLTYRMRQSGGDWKVIDVFYQGSVSQLTTQRSDFAATVASGGAPALVKKLDALSDTLMK
jgi:phospholipid transport system substrate-binding protein